MLRRVALVRTDVLEESIASITNKVFFRSVLWLLVTADVVPNSPVLVTPMMKALLSSETSSLTRAARHSIPEDGILHSYRRENL
jgi:hypothetical protein